MADQDRANSEAGRLLLFGSGETAPSGRRAWAAVLTRLGMRLAILETPAGFQPNSRAVARRVADFLQMRFPDLKLAFDILPVRRREQANDPTLLLPLVRADLVFLGAGSPTYAVRHLRDTLAWELIRYRWRHEGVTLVLASAGVLAAARFTLPVYEIYKVGADLHWKDGLALLPWVLLPHWNNTEGGQEVDTRYCFMGEARFRALCRLLPPDATLLGLEEHTALLWEAATGRGTVLGKGRVHVWQGAKRVAYLAGHGCDLPLALAPAPLSERGYRLLRQAGEAAMPPQPSPEVYAWVQEREEARRRRDWQRADALRERIRRAGWQVRDTPHGPELLPMGE